MAMVWGDSVAETPGLDESLGLVNEMRANVIAAVAAAKPASGAGEKTRVHHGFSKSASRAARITSSVNRPLLFNGGAWSSNFQTASFSQESSAGVVFRFMVRWE
jgi:hypothetical protein